MNINYGPYYEMEFIDCFFFIGKKNFKFQGVCLILIWPPVYGVN